MSNPLKTLLKPKTLPQPEPENRVYLNKELITILPMSYEDTLEVVFLLLPYLKLVTVVREKKKNGDYPIDVFFDVVENLIMQLRRQDLNKALRLILKKDEAFVSNITGPELVRCLPIIIKANNFIDLFFLMRSLGAFD